MAHISPLKTLFRRQKALRGVGDLIRDDKWKRVGPGWMSKPDFSFCGYSQTEWYTIAPEAIRQAAEVLEAWNDIP